jgi:glycosyltransferase involved in cell wall biosynthesis
MKKILIAITRGEVGGAQVFARDLALGLKKNNFDVTIALGSEHKEYLESESYGENIKLHIFKNLSRSFSPLKNILLVFEAKKYINQNDFDAIQLNSSNSIFIALAAKISKKKPLVIFTHHGLSFFDPNSNKRFSGFVIKMIFKILLNFVDINVFISQNNLQDAKKMGIINKNSKYEIIYNGSNTNFITKESSRAFLEEKINTPNDSSIIIGSIGRLAYPKNYEFLISAANHICEIKNFKQKIIFIVIGEGPERDRYEKLIKKYGLENNFFLVGELKNAAQYLKAFDISTLTSIYEGMPMVLIESLDAGIAILAPKVGGINEIVENDNDQLYSPQDIKQYEEKLKTLILDPTLRLKKGVENKIRSDKFSVETMVQKYINLLR